MDKLHSDVLSKLESIDDKINTLIKQGAIHNHILAEHEKRSTQLETRLTPIEDDLKFRNKMYQILLGSGGGIALMGLIITIYKHLL
jgi:hypothetical protein